MRSGAPTLLLLAAPLNVILLQSLADGPRRQSDLRSAAGSPAQTTLRARLKQLGEIGAIEKHRRNRFPGVLEHELTAAGRELLTVLHTLERWLEKAPSGSLAIGSNEAKAATKALAESWSTTMLRALAASPLSLTQLDGLIGSLSYPSLERRLAALRLAGQVEALPANGTGTPYAVTNWLRQGVAPLAVAARWERRYIPQATPPLSPLDAEAGFLLAAPMLRPAARLHGSCRAATEFSTDGKRRLSGVVIQVENGVVTSCTTKLEGSVEAWALGSAADWLNAVIDGSTDGLELGGDCALARALVDGLHETLFGAHPRRNLDLEGAIKEDGSK